MSRVNTLIFFTRNTVQTAHENHARRPQDLINQAPARTRLEKPDESPLDAPASRAQYNPDA
ncbi:hypothetical protein B0G76_0975 [Paraburkholderia sp. BL23I1N1]|nr:hypothetical protein B0G76_0975 [Paraburkholderia sp. BL23I1N1]